MQTIYREAESVHKLKDDKTMALWQYTDVANTIHMAVDFICIELAMINNIQWAGNT